MQRYFGGSFVQSEMQPKWLCSTVILFSDNGKKRTVKTVWLQKSNVFLYTVFHWNCVSASNKQMKCDYKCFKNHFYNNQAFKSAFKVQTKAPCQRWGQSHKTSIPKKATLRPFTSVHGVADVVFPKCHHTVLCPVVDPLS